MLLSADCPFTQHLHQATQEVFFAGMDLIKVKESGEQVPLQHLGGNSKPCSPTCWRQSSYNRLLLAAPVWRRKCQCHGNYMKLYSSKTPALLVSCGEGMDLNPDVEPSQTQNQFYLSPIRPLLFVCAPPQVVLSLGG